LGTDFACDHGEPVKHCAIVASRKATGFTAGEFEKRVELPSKRSAATRPIESIAKSTVARRWIDWRNAVVSQLLVQPENKSYRKDEVLKTLVP
jgi:hypothetical protein